METPDKIQLRKDLSIKLNLNHLCPKEVAGHHQYRDGEKKCGLCGFVPKVNNYQACGEE